jgi:hypothetical protein
MVSLDNYKYLKVILGLEFTEKHGLFASPRFNFILISAAMLPSSGNFSLRVSKIHPLM